MKRDERISPTPRFIGGQATAEETASLSHELESNQKQSTNSLSLNKTLYAEFDVYTEP